MNQPLSSASKPPETSTDTTVEQDDDLVERLQAGDTRAFRALFDKYHHRAFTVAVGVLRNEDDALDAVQEAFVKVHKNIHKFQGSSSFYTWLYRIVMNVSIDHVRRAKRRRTVDFDETIGRDSSDGAPSIAITPNLINADPGRSALRRELSEAIAVALQELPEHHRAVILLREVEGMSYEEMAEVLEVPKGTIMSRLFHARKKLQASLAPYLTGEQAEG